MRLLFLADGRSPIAQNWIAFFVAQGHEVHLASLYPCAPNLPLASLTNLPVALSGATEAAGGGKPGLKGRLLRAIATPAVRTWLRHRLVPRSLPRVAGAFQDLVARVQPDLLHAMRIPYEGMLAALALSPPSAAAPPLLISVWGNDFTLHASTTRLMVRLTRQAMQRADALHTDCCRDYYLARQWGFDPARPSVVLPGGGGIQPDLFYPPPEGERDPYLVVNPRGMRAYVRNDTFFQSIPQVLEHCPQARFLCPAMKGQPQAEKWVQKLGIAEAVELLPPQPRERMALLFRRAQVVVSPTMHDGTPNTLLEAMACGCFPVAGDIPSLWEWITPPENGLLADPADPAALADAILTALTDPELRRRARAQNARLIAERAEYGTVMAQAQAFYQQLIGG